MLSRRFGTKRVHANMVYQEYIHDRNHLHMNATRWETLTGFVKWLGREGKCTVDQTEKGWFITWIDRNPDTIARQEALAKKERMDKDDHERTLSFVNKQVQRAAQTNKDADEPSFTEFKKNSDEEKVSFKMPSGPAPKSKEKSEETLPSIAKEFFADVSEDRPQRKKTDGEDKHKRDSRKCEKRKMNLDELIVEEEAKKEKLNRKNYWLAKGIVVKIVTKLLGEKYYKKKAVVKEVKDLYGCVVQVLDTDDVLKLDQVYLETVIPAIGRRIRIVNGAYRNHVAVLDSLDEKTFCCTVKIDSGPLQGRIVNGVQYEDISKIHVDD